MAKINGVWFDTVASSSDFLTWYKQHEKEFDFSKDTVNDFMVDHMFKDSKLSSRYSQNFCKDVIAGNMGEYWKNLQPFYPIILKFMKEFNLQEIRFNCDW